MSRATHRSKAVQRWVTVGLVLSTFTGMSVLSGCGSDETPCTTGRVASCPCPGGGQGTQTCNDEGEWGMCECGPGHSDAAQGADTGHRFDGGERTDTIRSDVVGDTGSRRSDVDAEDGSDGSSSRLGPPHHLSESDFQFDTRLHAVNDLGMDPSGDEAIDDKLDEARAPNTLIVFPPGTYKIRAGAERDATHKWGPGNDSPAGHFGIKGLGDKPSDVQFLVEEQPPNYGGRWLAQDGGEGLLLKNFAIDMRRDDYTSANMVVDVEHLLLMEEVEWMGIVPSDDHGKNSLLRTAITDQSGTGELNRVYIRSGSIMPGYPDGMTGISVRPGHEGTMYLTDLWIQNLNSTAVGFRAQNLTGRVGVEGGYFKNNANNNIRGSAGDHPDGPSYIRGATIVIDSEDMGPKQPQGEELTSTDALTVNGPQPGYKGLLIENVDIYYLNTPGGLVLNRPDWARHGAFTLRDVRVKVEASGRLTSIESVPISIDETARFENLQVSGSGSGALWAEPSTTAEIVDSCVESNFDIENFDTEKNLSRNDCAEPRAPKAPPPR